VTVDELLDGILEREGPGTPPYLDPADRGGRTAWGIDERSHPEAWRNGPPSSHDAKVIYAKQYVQPFAPLVDAGLNDRVRIALVDDAVLSGVVTAIRTLQQVLGVTVDGIIGPETIAALVAHQDANGWLLMELVKRRAHRLARIVERDHTQARFVVGWIDRCLSLL
jgi:lysozyme family protein